MPKLTRFSSMLVALLAFIALPAAIFAQGATITGKITDDNQVPQVGANVTIDAMNISVGSNTAGQYTITIPGARVSGQSVVLRVRAIGFTPQTRTITISAGASTQNFSLAADINKLSQVVVTGVTAGTEQKMLPFVVAQVSSADMPVPNSNPLAELQGKVTGANIVSASGRPGSTPAIVLRGPQSIDATGRSQSPMFIVDGVEQIATASLSDINPNDIENIEVVKGAAAASLYGSRAGYGVISVTTKSGKATGEGVRFTTRAEFGASDIEHLYSLATTTIMMEDPTNTRFCIAVAGQPSCTHTVDIYAETLRINQGGSQFALAPASFINDGGISTNLGAVKLRGLYQSQEWPVTYNPIAQNVTNGPWTNINVDMTGKFGRANFFTSIGTLRQEGSIRFLDGYRRNSIRLNVDNTLGGNWTLSVRAYYAKVTQDNALGNGSTGGGGAFFDISRQPAYADLLRTDSYGRLFVRSNAQVQGAQNENPDYIDASQPQRGQNDRFQGNVQARWQPLPWLDGDFSIGYDRTNSFGDSFYDSGERSTNSSGTAYLGSISFSNTFSQSYNAAINFTARKDLRRDLNLRFTVRGLYEAQDDNFNNQNGTNLVVPGLFTSSALVPSASNTLGSSIDAIRQIGMFAGVDLEYKERYILNTQIRRDGSSLFGSANQWANYGRGSFAWRASEEAFWPFKNVINDFKLRAAVGQAGNRPSFSQQYQTFSITNGTVSASTLGNSNLRPELSTETELGFDAEILHKYGLTVTHALGIVSSELLQVPPSASSGFSNQWKNAGQLQNATWEFSLNVPLIEKRDLQYSARFNFDQTKSEITGIAEGVAPYYYGSTFYVAANVPYGAIYGRQFIKSCAQLGAAFVSQCGGPGSNFQKNSDGFIVWTGGYNLTDGITKNVWMAVNGAATAPFGVTESWGNPIILRDSLGHAITSQSFGSALPDFRYSIAQNFTWRKFTAYALLDAVKGNSIWNQGLEWSYGDFMNGVESQAGTSNVNMAKPLGYYFRAGAPDNAGVGGLYDIEQTNNNTVMNASYVKLREVSLGYRIGKIAGQGDWTVSVIGRNLKTWTPYIGFDPEVGVTGGASGSAALASDDSFGLPNLRTFTLQFSSSF